jgi:tRNA (guanine-N7-)-methyltransferase
MQPSWSSPNNRHVVRGRRGRLTARQQAALSHLDAPLIANVPLDVAAIWGSPRPVIVDIGFGHGESTLALAHKHPDAAIIAIDVHPPGIARLLQAIAAQHIENIRIIRGSIHDVLDTALRDVPIDAIWTLFPDPWPKARHHKRRLIQPDLVSRMAEATRAGAAWHIATDWAHYAEQIDDVFAADPHWIGGRCERPDRPVTKYEDRASRAGRLVLNFHFIRAD